MSKLNIGAGACPAGSSPAGFGVPGSIQSAYPRALVTADARVGSSAAINPKTGDYEIDATGANVYWDNAANKVTNVNTNAFFGKIVRGGGAGVNTAVEVLHLQPAP
jgi:hypothetical protein